MEKITEQTYVALRLEPVSLMTEDVKKGMIFIIEDFTLDNVLGTSKIFQVSEIPKNSKKFIEKNGFPITFILVDEDAQTIVNFSYNAWFDNGKRLIPFTMEHAENILNFMDGLLELKGEFNKLGSFKPVYKQDKLIIRYLTPNLDD